MELDLALLVVGGVVVLAALVVGGFWARRELQLCPHCAWVVRRVKKGWLRCPRCKKQYGKPARVRP
ncbi:MAG: hypothetical protein HYV61_02470 [Candidatus Rokubacteria bacterium]|nr:hypothetical protein [Candidatus Rokubacteria bacterium]